MLALRSYEKKNKDGFAAMTADELKFINGGASSKDYYRRDPSPTIAGKRRQQLLEPQFLYFFYEICGSYEGPV